MEKAWACFDQGRVNEAIQLARQSLEFASEGRPHAYAALGWFLLSAGSVDEAQSLLASSLGRYPEYAPLHWYLGLVHRQKLSLEDACQALTAAVTFDPDLDEAAVALAWVLGDLGRFDEAAYYAAHALSIKTQPDRLAQLGWFLLSQEQWAEAATVLEQALSELPNNPEARCHLVTALQQQHRNEEALQVLSAGLALNPSTPALLQHRVHVLLSLHRSEEALASLLQLLEQTPNDVANHTLASVLLERNGELQAASDHAEKAIAGDDQAAGAWRVLAQIRIRQNRLGDAALALKTALKLDSSNTGEPQQKLGWICVTEGQFEDAIEAFKAAVEYDTTDASAWYGLAKALHATHRFSEALTAVQRALHLNSKWLDALVLQGQILIDLGPDHWEAAVSQLNEALVLQPASIQARYHLAIALQNIDRKEEAEQVLSEGLKITPDSSDLLRRLADILLSERRTWEARTVCHQLLKLEPDKGTTWHLLSQLFVQQKRPGLALRALARARRTEFAVPSIWLQTGWLALETGNLSTALDAVDHLLELAPTEVTSHLLAAAAFERSGRIQAASHYAEKAVACDARSIEALRALAHLHLRQGHLIDAQAALEAALQLNPSDACGVYRQLGWVCVADSRYADATRAFRNAVHSDATDFGSWYGLAEALRAEHLFSEALQAIREAIQLRRDWPDAIQLRRRILGEQIDGSMRRALLDFRTTAEQPDSTLQHASNVPEDNAPETPYEYSLCSFSTLSHLPLLRTMTASARRNFSGKIFLLLIDSDDSALVPEGATPVFLSEVIAPALWGEMVARYNILELCCTLKPFLMRYVARTTGGPVVYVDADTYLLDSLGPSLPKKHDFSVFLTPHLLRPFEGERHVEEIGILRIGTYNAGVVAVGTDDDAFRFLDWWADRASRYAYDAPEHGVFTDQKWLDMVPSYFQNVQTCRDWGLNVGPWRVRAESDFSEDDTGCLMFCGVPVRLMHVSRFNPEKPALLTTYLPDAECTDSALGRFLRRYALEVIQNRQ
nr:tetratricopeptide repeat protein [uncultured Rhodoferax sp.]